MATAAVAAPPPVSRLVTQYPTQAEHSEPRTTLPTVICPANRPSTRITNGSDIPRRARARSVDQWVGQDSAPLRSSQEPGAVGSQLSRWCRSASLIRLHAVASVSLGL